MLIEKTILTNTKLTNNDKTIHYTNELLEKISQQKGDINIELDKHDGKVIGKVKKLTYEDNSLKALMDIPDNYIYNNVEVGFSTEIIPTKYTSNNDSQELIDGYLKNIVFLSDLNKTNQPNDKNTITRILNTNGDKMVDDVSKLYGQSQEEVRNLKQQLDKVQEKNKELTKTIKDNKKEYDKLMNEYNKGKDLYDKGKKEYEEVLKIANKYKEEQKAIKTTLLEKLVPKNEEGKQDEFKLNMYNKLEINELESLIKDEQPLPSTTPNGASGDGMKNNQEPPQHNTLDYTSIKKTFNL